MSSENDTSLANIFAPTPPDTRREEFIAGMRAAADFFEQYPDAPIPHGGVHLGTHIYGRDEFVAAARALGKFRKDFSTDYAHVSRDMGGGVVIDYQTMRDQVCKRTVVATREVEVEEPDPDLVAALPKIKRTETVDEVEWDCFPLLDGREGQA